MKELEFLDITLGQSAEFKVLLTEKMVEDFANLSGDFNPLHMDKDYATTTELGERIVHGMLLSSFFSQLIGMHLPGKYALYLSQNLQFHLPAKIGMEVLVHGSVEQIVSAVKTIKIRTEIINSENKQILVSGSAMVKLLK